ncbi:Cis-3-hydroxy-L-proline dehydratase [Fusarium oxysporum f. sp. rapae]|uniref:Cis-3-hydroxy-L-proline dehydratase n=1 Tax=Fusarium oxysporum f. sp. rapae TaxID=485398 RepID=A0A8J5NQX3_FUSOX|nr:Cis-3-hydroxy-L-proline dehydratase [Fusarium oxysporum f. sp. rapae]
MHIQDITVFSYDANYRFGTYSMSHGRFAKGHKSLVVRIRSNDGFEGWAETAPLGSDYLPSSFTGELAAIQELAPQLLGLDPRSPAAIDDVMDRAMMGAWAAKAVIDIACWDILGKSLGLPTATLFGGYLTERPRGFSVIGIRETEAAVAQAKEEFQKGATTMQLKAGDNALVDAQRVRSIRAALPDHVLLWVDANGGWNLDDALIFARAIGQDTAVGIEQPCRTLHDCAEFGRRTGLPVTLDESIVTLADLFEAHAAGITGVNIKPSRVGGLTKARLIRDAAVALDMVINCDDTWGCALTTVQNVLLATTTPSHRLRAVDLFTEWTEPLIADVPRMGADGRISLGTQPGNGYTTIFTDMLGEPLAQITSN